MTADLVMVKGVDLWAAAISGAERGYNRTTDDYEEYKNIFKDHFEACCKKYAPDLVKTKMNWKTAMLPVMFLMFHEHYVPEEERETQHAIDGTCQRTAQALIPFIKAEAAHEDVAGG